MSHVSCLPPPPRGGGGGGEALTLCVWVPTAKKQPPFFDKQQPLVLSPNLEPPLFMDTQEQPLEISVKW